MGEYGMLTEFPNDLYRIYFPLRSDKVIPELSKLLRIPNLEKSLEKKAAGLRWKMLELELEQKSRLEKERLIALGIFGLVLFPSRTGIVSLEAAAAYVEYENTRINPVASVLAETIMTLNHYRKAGKGAVRCCTQLLYIWMKPLRIVEEEEWGDLDNQGWVEKLKAVPSGGLKWKAPWAKAMDVLMSCGQRCWVPLVGITGYVMLLKLLKFVDGLWLPYVSELIIIVTTNKKEELHPALLVPGRLDIHMSNYTFYIFKCVAAIYLDFYHSQLFKEII
uniref:DUF7745 domain-containing protein n=1 Tax=Salix viminalis TaxID=40686 RepID=A0A6N2NM30_SALVM